MPSWIMKAALQGGLSLLPYRHHVNYLFQRYISHGLALSDASFESRLGYCAQHFDYFRRFGGSRNPTVLEVGTGWHPIIPIGMMLCGAESMLSIDITPLIRDELVKDTVALFVRYAEQGRLAALLPGLRAERLERVQTLLRQIESLGAVRACANAGIELRIADASTIMLNRIDLVVSNNTLEHIPANVIERILRHLRTMMPNDGVMSHLIDLNDHYIYFDPSISEYHFLRFSKAQWRWFNNPLHYQNRLRVSEYRAIHARAGLTIVREDSASAGSEDSLVLAPEFQAYSTADLLVNASWMVSQPG